MIDPTLRLEALARVAASGEPAVVLMDVVIGYGADPDPTARTDDVAVALLGLQVFTTGVSFELTVRMRPSARGRFGYSLDELVWRHGRHGSRFLFGVELADGRRVGSPLGGAGRDVLFQARGGSGGAASVEQTWWRRPARSPISHGYGSASVRDRRSRRGWARGQRVQVSSVRTAAGSSLTSVSGAANGVRRS